MKKSQLLAISYAYAEAAKKKYRHKAETLGIDLIFVCQSHYKTLGGFVRGYGSVAFNEAVKRCYGELKQTHVNEGNAGHYRDVMAQIKEYLAFVRE